MITDFLFLCKLFEIRIITQLKSNKKLRKGDPSMLGHKIRKKIVDLRLETFPS